MIHSRFARPLAAAAAALTLGLTAVPADAGSISFSIRSTVDTGNGLDVELELTNVGDEAARMVTPTAIVGEQKAEGKSVRVMGPGSKQTWNLRLADAAPDNGYYALLLRVAYEDANAYPFEALSATQFSVPANQRARSRVKGGLALPTIRGEASVDARLDLIVPKDRGRRYQVSIAMPKGTSVSKNEHTVTVDENGTVRVPLKARNRSLLPGTRTPAYVLVTSLDEDPPQTDILTRTVNITQPVKRANQINYLYIAYGLLALLIAAEIAVRFVLKMPASDPREDSFLAMLGDWAVALAPAAFLAAQYPWDALLAPTIAAGGDMGSLHYPTKLMAEEMIPRGQLTGWTMGNYAGFPSLHFYSTLPFAMIVFASKFFPMEQSFKIITLIGPTFLPVAAAYMFRALGYGRGAAGLAAVSVLPFLLQQGNSMWGGNIPSVLAGEFCHAMGLTIALVFVGTLHRCVKHGKSWVLPAFLLAVVGLCHTFAFFAAVWYSLYYVWPNKSIGERAKPTIAVYITAALLLCFWGVPLPSRLIWTSEWSMIWRIKEFTEVLPKVLWPAAYIAAANVAWMLLSELVLAVTGRRDKRDHLTGFPWSLVKPLDTEKQGFLLFCFGGGIFIYFLAPAVGFPDIRFIPVSQMFLCLLAADFIYWVGGVFFRNRVVFAAAGVAAVLAYSHQNLGYVPSWLNWNYTGYQGKPTWQLFKAINDHVRGDLNDPRVVFEHSQAHNRFGTSRAFENLPLFSGRSTLEGVFHQASPNSPFIFYLQSEASERGSGPFPQYSYTRLDPEKAFPHFRVFNATDIVAVSEKAKAAYDAHPKFERTFTQGQYAVFHAADAETGYVVPAANQPILYDGPDWKIAFYRWYKHYDLLDIPLVPAEMIPASAAREFELRSDSVQRLERRPYEGDCQVESELEQYAVRFKTTCPGRPHIVKVSYFPRWKATDGSAVLPVSPAFMLVVPENNEFEMVYARALVDWVGLLISLTGLAVLIGCAISRTLADGWANLVSRPFEPLVRLFATYPVILSIVLLLGAIGMGYSVRTHLRTPERAYQAAQQAYRERNFDEAIHRFENWIAEDKDTFKQATALYQLGVSYSEVENYASAAVIHERLRFQFPNVNYGAGTLYHLANSYARLGEPERAREYAAALEKEHPGTNWLNRLKREHKEVFAESDG